MTTPTPESQSSLQAQASAPATDGLQAVAWRHLNEESNSWTITTSADIAAIMREHGRRVEPLGVISPTPPAALDQQAVRDAALEEAAQAAYLRLHPNNERSDWTEFAHDQAKDAKAAADAIRALKSTNGGDAK